MQIYKTKANALSGTDFREIHNKAKVFLELFWPHLYKKPNFRDKVRRLKYLPCAFELIQESRCEPISKENPNKRAEIFHRFSGITKSGTHFFVQIKEEKQSGKKWFISVFPI